MTTTRYEPVIGLEVHVQLNTRTKIFCGCSTRFGAVPNSHVCPVCSGLPGALPVLNNAVVEYALKMALACGCRINRLSRFARKNYFYPDLPKGYQISQFEQPLAEGGSVDIWTNEGKIRSVRLTRIHLEEDAGKSVHGDAAGSLVDLNRAGIPLIEIVSEPDLTQPDEAATYMRMLRKMVRALSISDGNMEQGSLRCDANISLRPEGQTSLGVKTEIKNLNSFRFVQKALQYEIERQTKLLLAGKPIIQETRLFDADKGVTHPMRSKEEAHDYRYFPEPDLLPLQLSEAHVALLKQALPELPAAREKRYVEQLGLALDDVLALTKEAQLCHFFEAVLTAGANPRRAANWILTELIGRINSEIQITGLPVSPKQVAELLALWERGEISGKLAKNIWSKMWKTGEDASKIAERENLFQKNDRAEIEHIVDEIIAAHPAQAKQVQAGKEKVLGFFVGQVMRATQGKANPQLVNEILKSKMLND